MQKYNILQHAEESRLRAEAKLEEQKYRNMAFEDNDGPYSDSSYVGIRLDRVPQLDTFSELSNRAKEQYDEEKKRLRVAQEQARIRAKLNLANMELPTVDMKPLEVSALQQLPALLGVF